MLTYFDNAATTRIDASVADEIRRLSDLTLGNASSTHALGLQAARLVEGARFRIARALGAQAEEILFTSSGTEANNLALKGFCLANRGKGNHLVVSSIEHSSVSAAAAWLAENGFRYSVAEVNEEGRVTQAELEARLEPGTILVSVMHANNEIGSLQDLGMIAGVCAGRGIAFHCDAVQSFLKAPIDLGRQRIDLLSISAHKVHGPKGVGALYARKGVAIEPLLHGGGQENQLRSGTLNVEGIAGFGKAVEAFSPSQVGKMQALRGELIERIQARIPRAVLNSPRQGGICNVVNFSFPGFLSKDLIHELQRREIYVSAGSACMSKKSTGSFVVRAIGRGDDCVQSAVRMSLSKFSTSEEVRYLADSLAEITRAAEGGA